MNVVTNVLTTEFKGTSDGDQLNKHDWSRIIRNFLVFSSPALLAALFALQGFITNENHLPNQAQIWLAIGSGYQALLASVIDTIQKFKSENK